MPPLSRRQFLALAGSASAGLAVAGCGEEASRALIGPSHGAVAAAEQRRRRPGAPVRDIVVTAAPLSIDLGGLAATTWGYGSVPGQEVRLKAGEVLRARFVNNLPEPTTVHWHGLALRNDMDGVPDLTQPAVAPGDTFLYEFTAPDPGTFWFHPHVGLQLDRGLYTPLIVEDPGDPGAYDREFTVVLDDWTDGLGQAPEQTFDDLRAGRGAHAAHLKAAKEGGEPVPTVDFLQSPPGDVSYPLYLINGRRPSAPVVFDANPGDRVRMRIINAASDTPFRVALGGHRLTVTHTDGFPVEPVTADALVIAMAERYDVSFRVSGPGVFPLVALADAKTAQAMAVVRAGPGELPTSDAQPAELRGKIARIEDLHASQVVRLPEADLDRLYALDLGGGDKGYVWTINGRPHNGDPLDVEEGQRVRLVFHNRTTMFHPMHLHGHTFQVVLPSGEPGPRKDTTIVRPNQRVAVDFVADNPGQWMLHCHNLYHQQGGMMTTVSYVAKRGMRTEQTAASTLQLACQWLGRASGIA